MNNAIKVLLQMQNGFLQLESTLVSDRRFGFGQFRVKIKSFGEVSVSAKNQPKLFFVASRSLLI
jgi:hypothetical protein